MTKPVKCNCSVAVSAIVLSLTLSLIACSVGSRPIEKVVETVSRSVVQIDADAGHGSGFIIDKSGLVVTNAHVVGKASQVRLWLLNGRGYNGEVLGVDSRADLAVVQILGENQFEALRLGTPQETHLGEDVIALGFPFAEVGDNITITRGVLSSTRSVDGVKLLQTDAAINPGNSGGPLINMSGDVIGVNTFKITGRAVDNIGFAVSVEELKPRLPTLRVGPILTPSPVIQRAYQAPPTAIAKPAAPQGAIASGPAAPANAPRRPSIPTPSVWQKHLECRSALREINKLIDSDPTNAQNFVVRGNAYFECEDYEAAMTDFNLAIEIDPAFIEAYRARGELREHQGESELADDDYAQARELEKMRQQDSMQGGN